MRPRPRPARESERLRATRQATLSSIEGQLAEEARVDRLAHEAALEAIRAERDQTLARFAAVDEVQLERLARKALDQVLERGGGR